MTVARYAFHIKKQSYILKCIFALKAVSIIVSIVWFSNAWPMHAERDLSPPLTKNNAAAGALSSALSSPLQRGAVILQCGPNFQQQWYGRLGNNILSIFNAALDAQSRGLGFSLKDCSHPVLDLISYDYYNNSNFRTTRSDIKQSLTPAEAFFINIYDYPQQLGGLELILPFPAACCSKRRILTPLLEKYYSHPAAFKYSADALVMHIRSGDVFDRTRPAEYRYSPPPLAYYTRVIAEHQSRHSTHGNIVIVTEMDHISPLVSALLENYPEGMITLQAGTLEEDVAVVLAARHLVASQGTFAYALALGSHNLETLYMFNNIVHALDERAFYCDVKKVYNYSPKGGRYIEQWEASEAQIKYLMNFKKDDLVASVCETSNSTCDVASLL
jgi:hypothetical protein